MICGFCCFGTARPCVRWPHDDVFNFPFANGCGAVFDLGCLELGDRRTTGARDANLYSEGSVTGTDRLGAGATRGAAQEWFKDCGMQGDVLNAPQYAPCCFYSEYEHAHDLKVSTYHGVLVSLGNILHFVTDGGVGWMVSDAYDSSQ